MTAALYIILGHSALCESNPSHNAQVDHGVHDRDIPAAKKRVPGHTEKPVPVATPSAPVPISVPGGEQPAGRIVLDVTPLPALTGGGPALAIDADHPQTQLQLTEMAPAAETNAIRVLKRDTACRLSSSADGGFTWSFQQSLPADHAGDCHQPALAAAADGSFYAAARIRLASGHPSAGRGVAVALVSSDDAGKTWNSPIQPFAGIDPDALKARGFRPPSDISDLFDSPKLHIDAARGIVYVSAGGHPQRYIAGRTESGAAWSPPETPDCDEQAGGTVECWQYPARGDAAVAAAQGVVAALYPSGPPLKQTEPRRGACGQPCWIFSTSIDSGQHWRRVRLPPRLAGTVLADQPEAGFLAADSAHRGAFAIMLLRPQQASLQLATTANGGASWSSSYVLNEDPANRVIGRPALAYSPAGIIGVVWRSSIRIKGKKAVSLGTSQDIFAAISRDGGRSFSSPLRIDPVVPAEGHPWPDAAPAGTSQSPSLAIDAAYLYAAWDQYDDGQPHNLSHGWFARVPLLEFGAR